MTEQELKDAITSACEADYKHAMAAPKHRFSRTFRKKIKVLLQPDVVKHTIPALYPVHGRRLHNGVWCRCGWLCGQNRRSKICQYCSL